MTTATTSTLKTRDGHLDLLSGVLLLLMISHHFLHTVGAQRLLHIVNLIVPYFMCWFFFKGGMFFSYGQLSKTYASKSARRLLFPYFAFAVIGLFITLLTPDHTLITWDNQIIDIFILGLPRVNGPLWYLAALFAIRIICRYCCRSWRSSIVTLMVTFVCLLLHHFGVLTHEFWGFPMRVAHGMVFFIAGILLHDWQYHRYVFYVALPIIVLYYVWFPSYVTAYDNMLQWGDYIPFFVCSLAGIIVLNTITKPLPQPKVLLWLSRNSIFILCIHMPLILFFNAFFRTHIQFHSTILFAIAVGLSTLLITLLLFPLFKYTRLKVLIGE